jgi:hypothetical protein
VCSPKKIDDNVDTEHYFTPNPPTLSQRTKKNAKTLGRFSGRRQKQQQKQEQQHEQKQEEEEEKQQQQTRRQRTTQDKKQTTNNKHM